MNYSNISFIGIQDIINNNCDFLKDNVFQYSLNLMAVWLLLEIIIEITDSDKLRLMFRQCLYFALPVYFSIIFSYIYESDYGFSYRTFPIMVLALLYILSLIARFIYNRIIPNHNNRNN